MVTTMKYQIIQSNSIYSLAEQVQYFIKQGWEPQGGISVDPSHTPSWLFQAMIKND